MTGSVAVDVAVILGALGAFIAALTSAVVSLRTTRKVDAVHGEIKTLNNLSLANLADAQETRRVAAIPEVDRSAVESEFLAESLEADPTRREKA